MLGEETSESGGCDELVETMLRLGVETHTKRRTFLSQILFNFKDHSN